MGWAKRRMMELTERGFGETGELTVCLNCIEDETLRDRVSAHLSEWTCSFCDAVSDEDADEPIAAPFEDFMYIVMEAVNFLYMSVDDAGLVYDEGEWFGGTVLDSEDVAYSVCEGDVSDEVLEAISNAIEPQLWTDSHISESPPDGALRWGWEALCERVKHSSRFVFLSRFEESSRHPDDFTTGELLARLEKIIVDNNILLSVPAGKEFWRGRLTDNPMNVSTYKSAEDLGAPPRDRASNSRMSPAGISMFYGSVDVDTVVAEIGAHSTQRYAIVGAFETVRDLTLLNLADLPQIPSLYRDAGRGQRYYDLKFLRSFAADLAKPITLDGREHIEYVPTQVVTEYLRYVSDLSIDGILFRSAQNNGVNCVVFCDRDGCIDQEGTPNKPYLKTEDIYLQLKPDSVKWVRIVSAVAP